MGGVWRRGRQNGVAQARKGHEGERNQIIQSKTKATLGGGSGKERWQSKEKETPKRKKSGATEKASGMTNRFREQITS